MIDITRAQANQTTINGVDKEWIITLDKEELYVLPAHFSVQETFLVRRIVEQMIKRAVKEATDLLDKHSTLHMQKVIINGDAQLDALRRENIRLANTLEHLTQQGVN